MYHLKYILRPSLLRIVLFCTILSLPALAQRPVVVSYRQDQKGAYIFTAQNNAFCPYVLRVVFTSLENGKTDHPLPFEGELRPGMNNLFRLSAQSPAADVQFKYSVSFRKCCLLASP